MTTITNSGMSYIYNTRNHILAAYEWIQADLLHLNQNKPVIYNPEQLLMKLREGITIDDDDDWRLLSGNPNAIHIIERNLDKVDWTILSGNPNAIWLLERNIDKVDWTMLSRNTNPNAIHIMKMMKNNLDNV